MRCIRCVQANLAVQEVKYVCALRDLSEAQSQLDEKQKELDIAKAFYDQAMREKQVKTTASCSQSRSFVETPVDWIVLTPTNAAFLKHELDSG